MPDAYYGAAPAPFELSVFSPAPSARSGSVENFGWKEIDGIIGAPRKSGNKLSAVAEDESDAAEDPFFEARQKAAEESARLIAEAGARAEEIKRAAREEGRALGYREGFDEGKTEAAAEEKRRAEAEIAGALADVKAAVEAIESRSGEIIGDRIKELRDLAVAVAEKVIRVSLKSSSEVIENMIAAATERVTGRQWAKISVSKYDARLLTEAGVDILEALGDVSGRVKLEILEEAGAGTCIIELPDRIIDAGADTQLENIKELLS